MKQKIAKKKRKETEWGKEEKRGKRENEGMRDYLVIPLSSLTTLLNGVT